jgi:hypothetical protein
MATTAILKKNQPLKAQFHMAYDIPTIETKKGGFKNFLDSFHQTS